jgi:hypothetical protein
MLFFKGFMTSVYGVLDVQIWVRIYCSLWGFSCSYLLSLRVSDVCICGSLCQDLETIAALAGDPWAMDALDTLPSTDDVASPAAGGSH